MSYTVPMQNLAWTIKQVEDFATLIEMDKARYAKRRSTSLADRRLDVPPQPESSGASPGDLARAVHQRLSTIIQIAQRFEPGVIDGLRVEDGVGWRWNSR